MRCPEFGEWVDAVDGKPGGTGLEWLRHLATCPACREQQRQARRLRQAMAKPGRHEHLDPAQVAEMLARERTLPEAWRCAECFELVYQSARSLESAEETAPTPIRSNLREELRRRAGIQAAGKSASRSWSVPAGAVAALAAMTVLALLILPSDHPEWARSIGLEMAALQSLPDELVADVRRAVEEGTLAPAVFELPPERTDVERDAPGDDGRPRLTGPVWTAVTGPRPEFRWNATTSAERYEIVVLDANRRFLWSRDASEAGRLPYPDGVDPLEPGDDYFWKVNAYVGEEMHASPFAGFRVLPSTRAEDCLERAGQAFENAFVAGVVFDRCGLYDRAAAAFRQAGADEAVAAVRQKQGLR